jgi:hypothetical protein
MKKIRLSGLRACLRGGNANNGANAGFVNLNTNNTASNTNTNIGSQLSYWVSNIQRPCLLAKNHEQKTVLVMQMKAL